MTGKDAKRARQPRGRRAGSPDTKAAVLDAARQAFAEHGFDGTSVRHIATAAGVDPALVHHYFGAKRDLFLAAVKFPVDPAELVGQIAGGPAEAVGERFAAVFVRTWDDPVHGPALEAVARAALASRESGALIREFFAVHIVEKVVPQLVAEQDPADVARRSSFVASQLLGLAVTRHLLRFEPIASMPAEQVVQQVGPTIQRYLTGPLSVDIATERRGADSDEQ